MAKNAPHFNKMYWCLLVLFILLPEFARAAVFINEIAWMGDSDSANHEWIELYNNGAAQAVDGWTLSDGRNLSITLAGTISANTYAVLERTSDDSAPGTKFLIYTGALPNTGGTLKLTDAQGQLVDQVAGGTDWSAIGGDNTTKETAQYSQKGWLTAAATPGAQNHSQGTVEQEVEDKETKEPETEPTAKSKSSASSQSKGSKKKVESVRLTLPDVTLELAIDAQSVGYVNQTIPLLVEASGIGKNLLSSLQYQWNFGDGTTATAKEPSHRYQFPGTYVVTLHAQFKRQRQIARHEITILPVQLSLTKNSAGDIQLNNDSAYEVDISGYTVRGSRDFVFPQYSLLLPNQTITIPRHKVASQQPVLAAVYDKQQVHLASALPATLAARSTTQLASAATPAATVAYTAARPRSLATPTTASPAAAPTLPTTVAAVSPPASGLENQPQQTPQLGSTTQLVAAAPAAPDTLTRQQRLSYVGLIIIILLATLAIYLTPRRQKFN